MLKGREFHKIAVAEGVRCLIFDCDGTLADTMPIHWNAWFATLKKFGLSCPVEFLEKYSGVPTREIVRSLNKQFGWSLDPEEFYKIKQAELGNGLRSAKSIAPVVDLVRQQHGILPMSVVSGGYLDNVMTSLKGCGIESCFDCIVTANDGLPSKPSAEPFLYAAAQLKIPPEQCQVFEDADLGIKAAIDAGMIATDVRIALASDAK